MKKLSSQPYKGTRDFYPEDKQLQNYIFGVWREVCERYGYEEYDAPLLEPLELYEAKTGQEIVNEQTYSFTDRGSRRVSVRPEMTPTVSRMVAARRQQLAYPLRWYSIANFMRYERPQKGRLREFWQLNVDVFGIGDSEAELEVIEIADAIMREFGAKDEMFTIKLNSRPLIGLVMTKYLGLDAKQSLAMVKLLDRVSKITESEILQEIQEISKSTEEAKQLRQKVKALEKVKTLDELPAELRQSTEAKELREVAEQLTRRGVKSFEFDMFLMRGFDYYTGVVFEVFDKSPENRRSLFGGGRYDGLVGLFGVDPVPTVGFAPGDVTAEEFLKAHNLMPKLESQTGVYLAALDADPGYVPSLATKLRKAGVNVAIDVTQRSIQKKLKTASQKSVRFVVLVGKKEQADGKYTLKDLTTGKQSQLALKELLRVIK